MDLSAAAVASCPACGTPGAAADHFCEQCGAALDAGAEPVAAGCHACGALAVGADGWCAVCGARGRPASDRVELDLAVAAAVSDRGRVHRRNEDAFHLELVADRGVAAVVCDGVSSAAAGDLAARTAARTAGAILAEAIADPTSDGQAATLAAIGAAHAAVGEVPWELETDRALPSCTLVSVVSRGGEVVVGWLGDSRAYWISPEEERQLTVDDSWATEEVAAGRMTPEEAAGDRRFHAITHWVGADSPDRPPGVLTFRPAAPGRLVLCTDGLWNYAPGAGELAALVGALPREAATAAVCRSLTETALARGGRDNITVAVIDVDPAGSRS
ncbi:MAG: protein phosphatase 2C domain-containing protein [Solirubrobacteraceae bacterium]